MTTWLPTLMTNTPEDGYALSRMAVKLMHPDTNERERMRPNNAEDATTQISVSQVVATHFATIAAANNCWTSGK